jgi:hypothetical protein
VRQQFSTVENEELIMKTPRYKLLLDKSIASAVSAIEIYNKPDFLYREETFSILMINAWELLLKSKILFETNNKAASIYEFEHHTNKTGKTSKKVYIKRNRAGNPHTIGLMRALNKLISDCSIKIDESCMANINLLMEIRDNSVHYRNDHPLLKLRVQEVGTASLKNYLTLIKEWFGEDLSKFNFYLMPLSFYHEFELMESFTLSSKNKEINGLLKHIHNKATQFNSNPENPFNVILGIQTKFVKSTDPSALPFTYSDDPDAIKITYGEEDIRRRYPLDYKELNRTLRKRYTDFKENQNYHKIRTDLAGNRRYCRLRYLDPNNPKSSKKPFFSKEIIHLFDPYYTKKKS